MILRNTRALEKENDKSIRGERKVRIARTKTAFYEMIAQSKTEEANSLNNNADTTCLGHIWC